MIQLDKAMQMSQKITSDEIRTPVVAEEIIAPKIETTKTPSPKPIVAPIKEKKIEYDPIIDIVVESDTETTRKPAIASVQPPAITLNNIIATDELWEELTKSLITSKDIYLQPLLNDFTKELREKLLEL